MAFGDEVLSADDGCGRACAELMRDAVQKHTRLARKLSEVEAGYLELS
jgi:hypothetical protein